MKTNSDARIWCSENYNDAQETFYIYNAKKIIFEEWRTSWMHALFSVGLVSAGFTFGFITNPLLLLASMQVGFALYGILSYCHNDQGAGGLAYIATLIFFPNVLKDASAIRTVFICAGMVLLLASAITERNYRKVLGSYTQTTQRQWANDEEEFEAWKRKYYTGYSRNTGTSSNANYDSANDNNYQNAYTEPARPVNPYTEKAQALFADFGNTYIELKKRYRKLAHQHHPDIAGGDHEMFVAIVNEYEYLKATRFPGEV